MLRGHGRLTFPICHDTKIWDEDSFVLLPLVDSHHERQTGLKFWYVGSTDLESVQMAPLINLLQELENGITREKWYKNDK